MESISTETWLTLIAIVVGPIIALQLQRFLDKRARSEQTKDALFFTMMSNRGNRLSIAWVESLNSIDYVFAGKRTWSGQRQTKREKNVVDKWQVLRQRFNEPQSKSTGTEFQAWLERQQKAVIDLLVAMAEERGYYFPTTEIDTGAYSPTGHADFEREQAQIRKALATSLSEGLGIPVQMVLPKDFTDDFRTSFQNTMQNFASNVVYNVRVVDSVENPMHVDILNNEKHPVQVEIVAEDSGTTSTDDQPNANSESAQRT
ncbi:MAG: DUF6680 family protein [Pseudomonadota bacterium]